MNTSSTISRRDRVTRAAVEVLGHLGASGLTHRAVDRHEGLPEGSTSNHFRTRDALVGAVCRWLAEHDLATLAAVEDTFAPDNLTITGVAESLAVVVKLWTGEEAELTAARLELFLMARRDSHLAEQLADVRQAFHARAGDWLERLEPGSGQQAGYVMAVIEGLTANQLLHANHRMTEDEVRASLERMLHTTVHAA